MRTFVLLAGLACLPLSGWAEKPNVIVIYTDDHGWPDLGVHGIYEDLKTPHIDALAKDGVRATNGYSTAPQCVPSRGGLLAGRFQSRFGLESNASDVAVFEGEITLAERLKKAGYATGQIGKWHLGPTNDIPSHGFDDVYAKNANRPCSANFTLDGETIPMQQVDDDLYHLDACSEAALAFIDRHQDQPFFLYLAYRAPHVPLDAPKKYLDRFPGEMPERRRQALAMLSSMDDGIGAIRERLAERDLTEQTLIFYIGDNGAPLKIHKLDAPGGGPGWDGSLNEPMNGEKGMLAEGGIRVPFLVTWPGTIPAGQVYEEPVTALDVAATSVAIAGLPDDPILDGVNLIPYLSGEVDGAPHERLFWRWISQATVREGRWKFLRGGDREYLFDLEADPGESRNLLKDHPDRANELRTALAQWCGELVDPGLPSGAMSETWEAYFDFYLDGKPAPPLRVKREAETGATALSGWLLRGGIAQARATGVKLEPENPRKDPFLTRNGLQLQGPVTAKVRLRAPKGGSLRFAWREADQKDFVAGQTVSSEVQAGMDPQDLEMILPSRAQVVHLRVFLPREAELRTLHFTPESGEAKRYSFGKAD